MEGIKLKFINLVSVNDFTYEFLEKKYQEMESFLEQETLQRDGNLEEDYGDALIKQFKDIHEEDEFNGKIHLNEHQPEGNTWLVVGNTKVRSPSREGGYKGFIIECHNNHPLTERGLLTSIGDNAGKKAMSICSDDWKTGEALGWGEKFYKNKDIQRHSKDLRGQPKEKYREILRKILS